MRPKTSQRFCHNFFERNCPLTQTLHDKSAVPCNADVMKTAFLLAVLAAPVAAQDFAVRASDTVPTKVDLSETILDRELEYFDGGISRYAADGTYSWTYTQENGGATLPGVHDIQQGGVVCVTYDDRGQARCDMFVFSNDRLTLLTEDGQRYPIREIR